MTKKTSCKGKKGCRKKQHGGWIWSEGGLSKAYDDVKEVHDYIKDKKLISRGLPILGSIASVITKNPKFAQKGLEYGIQANQAGYGFVTDHAMHNMHSVSQALPKGFNWSSIPKVSMVGQGRRMTGRGSHNQTNTSSFEAVKF